VDRRRPVHVTGSVDQLVEGRALQGVFGRGCGEAIANMPSPGDVEGEEE